MRFLTIFLFSAFIFGVVSCNRVTSADDLKRIMEMEKRVNEARLHPPQFAEDINLFPFQELAINYQDFVDKYPEAKECPDLLFKAGEIYSQELGEIPRAIELFTRCYQQFPDQKAAPHALFLIAYLYNNSLKNYERAGENYRLFLEKYPNHELSKSARFEIEQMGISPEKLLKNITSQNAEDSVKSPK